MKKYAGLFITVPMILLLSSSPGADEGHASHEDRGEVLGEVHFPTSCGGGVQKPFERGVALLHSFWYSEAEKAFRAVAGADPNCAMAYWGIAMSLYHPLWEAPGPADLKAGSEAVGKAVSLGAKTDRERDYITAIQAFYKDPETLDHRTRQLAYEKAMESVYERYPEDREAAVFYALALNSTAPPTDKNFANQKKAGEILNKVFSKESNHPGVVHYIIHAYDSPPLAHLALASARSYAKIAPSAPHALHMPSHIFTRLGLWDESIRSNRASSSAARAKAAQAGPGAASFEELHALDYLLYAYLQRAEDEQAKALMDEIRGIKKAAPENFASAYALAAMPARFAIEKRLWKEAAGLKPMPESFPWSKFPWTEAITVYARGIGAARSGDLAGARKDLEKLESLNQSIVEAKQTYWADQVEAQRLALAAWIAREEGKNEEAVKAMRAAADREESAGKHPVTPGPIVPIREMLGELLLEINQAALALKEFEAALSASPNRFGGLYGAARSAQAAGNAEKAKAFYSKLITLSDPVESDRAELHEARAYLTKK